MNFTSVLTYFAGNAGAVIAGLIFWWTIENMQPIEQPRRKLEQLSQVILLSMLLTPLVALIISLFIRSRKLMESVKHSGD
jgi:hypothetical protein